MMINPNIESDLREPSSSFSIHRGKLNEKYSRDFDKISLILAVSKMVVTIFVFLFISKLTG